MRCTQHTTGQRSSPTHPLSREPLSPHAQPRAGSSVWPKSRLRELGAAKISISSAVTVTRVHECERAVIRHTRARAKRAVTRARVQRAPSRMRACKVRRHACARAKRAVMRVRRASRPRSTQCAGASGASRPHSTCALGSLLNPHFLPDGVGRENASLHPDLAGGPCPCPAPAF